MKDEILNLRRFFRNRFQRLIDHDDADGSGTGDGSAIGLAKVCELLANDDESFPRNYDQDLRRFCGHEASVWFREERSYGDVARLVIRVLEARSNGNTRPTGFWVSKALHCNSPIIHMRSVENITWERNNAER
ncbi:hypothetical protein FY140_04530 [Agrobacterium tumefaciens]|uniref:hypothetical protein n=1 Tax=Agrobacterium tumefaciens TaxID=358 RepID=UPI0021D3BAB9|nr:hypothetical protein [Agrobacterium tumefaciens]UXT20034.1 hypothetical protein FY140_04530 [Agrobacterium tumefaciens]